MITVSYPLFYAMFLLHGLIYLLGPILLFRAGRPVAGGLVMVAATLIPIAAQTWFTDSDSPSLGLLIMLELPPALLVLLAAVPISAVKLMKRLHRPSSR